MKARTNDFKNELTKLGKEIDFKINLYLNDKLITQDNKFIITQDQMKLVVEQFNEDEIDETVGAENIYNAVVVSKGNLLSTLMKEFDFEISDDLRVGEMVDCSFGLKVGENYEYINYGKFIIYSKEKNEDTNTYSYVAFDSMLFSMIEVDDTSIIQNVTVQQAIENICDKVGLTVNITEDDITNYPNLEKVINEKAFTDIEMTYRDVLDMICQCLGLSMIVDGKELKLKPLNNTVVDTIDANYLKDTNVKFSDKYMINSVVLSRSEDSDNIYRKDNESISENGIHEFKIKDNLIMLYDDREDYIDEIFEQLNGLEFYINDYTSTGITYLDWLDFYNVEIEGNTYKCLMLNDEIKVQQGLEESVYTEKPEETVTDYKTSAKTDKEVSFIVDKQSGEIKARVTEAEMESAISQTAEEINIEVAKKVGNDEVISKINQSAEQIQIDANKISLTGKTINMTSDNIAINSTNFNVNKNGNVSISATDSNNNLKLINNYSTRTTNTVVSGNGIYLSNEGENTILGSLYNVLTYAQLDLRKNDNSSYINIWPGNIYSNVGVDISGGNLKNYFTYSTTISSSPNMYVGSDGMFKRSTSSSQRYKKDIKDVSNKELNIDKLLEVPIRQFKYKDDYISKDDKKYNKDIIGFIVEELEKYYPIAVDYNEEGQPEMWNSQILIPAMLGLIQKLEKRISTLEKESDK